LDPNCALLKDTRTLRNICKASRATRGNNKHAVAAVRRDAQNRAESLRSALEELVYGGVRSGRSIAAALNKRGIATARRGKWHASTICRLLKRLGLRAPSGDLRP